MRVADGSGAGYVPRRGRAPALPSFPCCLSDSLKYAPCRDISANAAESLALVHHGIQQRIAGPIGSQVYNKDSFPGARIQEQAFVNSNDFDYDLSQTTHQTIPAVIQGTSSMTSSRQTSRRNFLQGVAATGAAGFLTSSTSQVFGATSPNERRATNRGEVRRSG